MGRPPCCDKEGIKKGPWTPEEDIILVSYIQEHGPGNWRSPQIRQALDQRGEPDQAYELIEHFEIEKIEHAMNDHSASPQAPLFRVWERIKLQAPIFFGD
uniref:Uncharacterized protein n=1 Tax=Oryza nivara TaxID=4536 RepID=A0A0E0IXN6_ORYNI